MIAVIVSLFMTLLWYFFDNRRAKKPPVNQPIHPLRSVIRNVNIDAYKQQFVERQLDGQSRDEPLGRLYYSTPGRTYTCFVWRGRVLNVGKSWPYPPNNP